MAKDKWNEEQLIARDLSLAMMAIHEISTTINMPDHFVAVDRFANANVHRIMLPEYEDLWNKVSFKSEVGLDSITTATIELIRIALDVGKQVNKYRSMSGRVKVDFVSMAASLDIKKKEDENATPDIP